MRSRGTLKGVNPFVWEKVTQRGNIRLVSPDLELATMECTGLTEANLSRVTSVLKFTS